MTYIYIYVGLLMSITVGSNDVVVVPPGASLIANADWQNMIAAAGNEAALIAQLGVTDLRGEG